MFNTQPFIDVATANEYFATRLDTQDWDDASSTDQLKALITATNAILNLKFRCDFIINIDIQIATCEEAITRLSGIDMEQEFKSLYKTADSYASMSTTSHQAITRDNIRAGIASAKAWQYLLPYLADPQNLTLLRG